MEFWYKVVTPRKEVREGRSFNPDEFAIALEQVVAGTAPEDYKDPAKFFTRTCFTRALTEHAGMVLRRLAGKTENTAPVLTLVPHPRIVKTPRLQAKHGPAICERREHEPPSPSRGEGWDGGEPSRCPQITPTRALPLRRGRGVRVGFKPTFHKPLGFQLRIGSELRSH